MCTCLRISNKKHYFGRTLDLEFHFHEEAVITPRNYEFIRPHAEKIINKYALIGTAFVCNNYPMYYEACNEYGLAMAGLNFPYNATYNKPINGKLNLAIFELFPYLLGNYKTIKEIRPILNNLNITDEAFNEQLPISPLHFMISDSKECIVLEQTKDGLIIHENPYNVMTNNPLFDMQVQNLDKYKNLANEFKLADDPIYGCVGLGAVGLPGDYSSQSRFVKAYFMQKYAKEYEREEDNVSQFFHILDSVSMVKNTVLTKTNLSDITFYTACINVTDGIYYYKTYDNNQISALKLSKENMESNSLTRHPLITRQNINYIN